MGAGNVRRVFGLWGHLPDRPFRLLVFMANTAKDGDDPPEFWGSRETAALAFGRRVPDEPDAADGSAAALAARRERKAAFAVVDRAMKPLVSEGAIEQSGKPAPGRTARYDLKLSVGDVRSSVRRKPRGFTHESAVAARQKRRDSHDAERRANGPRSALASDHAERGERATHGVETDYAQRGAEEEQEDGGSFRGRMEKQGRPPQVEKEGSESATEAAS